MYVTISELNIDTCWTKTIFWLHCKCGRILTDEIDARKNRIVPIDKEGALFMEQIKRSLWKRFVAIAQPYFFPDIRGGGWAMLLLLIMLLVFLFGVLFLIVAGVDIGGKSLCTGSDCKDCLRSVIQSLQEFSIPKPG